MRRLSPVVAALGAFACSDSGVTKFNTDPTAEVSSHADGDTVREGYAETLRGTVGDANHAIGDLSVTWLVDGSSVCVDASPDAEGLVTCEHTFLPTGGEVVLEVRDPEGGSGSARVTVDVQPTDAPVAEITAPTADGVYYSDQLTTLSGRVSDGEDAAASLAVAWESSADGALVGGFDTPDSEGGLLGAVTLSEGDHFLTLTVTDSTGKEGRDSTTIQVGPPNSSPTCAITSPPSGTAGPEGELVTFTGDVDDVDVSADWLSVSWESDKDGPLGDSAPNSSGGVTFPYAGLTVDTHVVTMTVTDEVGATCAADVVYTVGTPPELTVTSPLDGAVFNETDAVPFTATVVDNEDLETDISLSWTSDVDGEFSTQGADSTGAVSFSVDTLAAGAHALTVRATDTDGLYAQASLGITINAVPTAPTVLLSPDPAYTGSTLTASASGSTDPDGSGTVTYQYAWYEDGVASSISTSAVFPSSGTSKYSTYRVVVTPSDGTGSGPTGEAEITIDNTAPVLSGPTLSSSTAQVGDVLTCTATATDADAVDTVTVTYSWSDGSTGSSYTVASPDVAVGSVACTATADDGDGGADSASASATITNTAPTVSTPSLSPSTVYTDDTLSANVTTSDAEGDPLTVTYDWYVDGSSVQDGTDNTLSGVSHFDKGQTVYVIVTADDGTDSTSMTSGTVTVSNTAPTAPVVVIDPGDPVSGEDLVCEVTTASTDADGDTVTYTMAWTVDTVAHGGALTTTWTDDTVDGGDTAGGEVWSCTATPNDGDDDGGTAIDSVTVDGACNDGSVVVSSSGVDFVEICAGSFDMGCTPGQSGCQADESPVTPVTLTRNYYVSQTEITQGQYQALMGSHPSACTACVPDTPVEMVSWDMAAAYANELSAADGFADCYRCTGSGSSTSCELAVDVYVCEGYRLPTEAEWEGAARCGEDLLYAGSTTIGDVAWHAGNSSATPHSVAGLDANACGLFDMSGNVQEWTQDLYDASAYTATGRTDPTGATSGTLRVDRGGSWYSAASFVRLSNRNARPPGDVQGFLGFRIVRTVDGDYDGDGYLMSDDCDDTDPTVGPRAADADCDGYGTAVDCDDTDPGIHPLAGDVFGDGVDSDCDGMDCEADSIGGVYFAACHVSGSTWSASETRCTTAGHDGLATITSASENSFIDGLMYYDTSLSNNDLYWIGYNDIASEGSWVWTSGISSSYTAWGAGEPNNDGGIGDCAHLYAPPFSLSGTWNDHPCSNLQSFVCESR